MLKLEHDFPQPKQTDLKAGEVIVKVSHVMLFAPEVHLMSLFPHFNSKPWIPVWQFSGTIASVSKATSNEADPEVKEGDAVFGMVSPDAFLKYNGALAEYLLVSKKSLVLKPATAKLEQAAGLAGAGSTVIGFAEDGGLLVVEQTTEGPKITSQAEGKRILITGGSTGTGIAMIQFFKHLIGKNGKIVTTASPRNLEAVRLFGADNVIDYTKHKELHKYLAENYSSDPFDAIIDITGSDDLLYPRCPSYLKPEGFFAFAGSMKQTHATPGSSLWGAISWVLTTSRQVFGWAAHSYWPVMLGGVPRRSFFHSGKPTPRNLELVRQLTEAGVLQSIVDSVWEMEDAQQAYEHVSSGKIRGQVIIRVGKTE